MTPLQEITHELDLQDSDSLFYGTPPLPDPEDSIFEDLTIPDDLRHIFDD